MPTLIRLALRRAPSMKYLVLGIEDFSDGSMAKKLFLLRVPAFAWPGAIRPERSNDFAHYSH